jgi:hypothetical protein
LRQNTLAEKLIIQEGRFAAKLMHHSKTGCITIGASCGLGTTYLLTRKLLNGNRNEYMENIPADLAKLTRPGQDNLAKPFISSAHTFGKPSAITLYKTKWRVKGTPRKELLGQRFFRASLLHFSPQLAFFLASATQKSTEKPAIAPIRGLA